MRQDRTKPSRTYRMRKPIWLTLLLLSASACEGLIEAGSNGRSGGASAAVIPIEEPLGPVVCGPSLPLLPRRIVRHDANAYALTVHSIYNWRGQYYAQPVKFVAPFIRANPGDLFTTFSSAAGVDEYDLDDALTTARMVSEHYVRHPFARPGPICSGAAGCERAAFAEVMSRLFNRKVTGAELDDAEADFRRHVAAGAQPLRAIELVMQSILLSPHLLFRTELGGPAGLTPEERARLLSYGLHGAPPDGALWALANATDGGLGDEAALRAEFRRHTLKPEDLPSLRRFLSEYFDFASVTRVTKDGRSSFHRPAVLVENTEAVIKRQVQASARAGLLRRLLTSDDVAVSDSTGESWNGPVGTTTVPKRVGILTHPAWLAGFSEPNHNNIAKRGRFIRERLLCTPVPQLPAGLFPSVPDRPGQTYRQRMEVLTASASCSGCHKLMNGLGGALEGYDHFGRPQSTDNGSPVNAAGVVEFEGQPNVAFSDVAGLMNALADSRQVHDCFVTNLFSFYVGRTPTREDACVLKRLKAVYRETGEDTMAVLEELFVWQATTPRRPVGAP